MLDAKLGDVDVKRRGQQAVGERDVSEHAGARGRGLVRT